MRPPATHYTVVYTLEALGQLRALPGAAQGRVQERAEALARVLDPEVRSPARSSMRWAEVEGCQLFYELDRAGHVLRVVRLVEVRAEAGESPGGRSAG